ncbi:helix-turn-helix domain-containing protein [Mangrovivirga cuniculi]|uniref:AraC family transcriptional regulator n=1 Tax=Mangrovivirga cuniculi TaxID=2715131 RepID=A0A4D7JM58_9BACT|nr:AraC family transcriptional regulator [Mangrovivirga cuniculi]QCK13682.1 AraC family transcriptional regulator [Mangrovivirga cuniculi]
MEDYNKIIESLSVKFLSAKNIEVLRSVTVKNLYDVENTILKLRHGEISFGEDEIETLREGEILFVPGGKGVPITYGPQPADQVKSDDFLNLKENYLKSGRELFSPSNSDDTYFSSISFTAKVFDSVNFFASLDIPPFIIRNDEKLSNLIEEIIEEQSNELPGRDRLIKVNTDLLVVEVIRYIFRNELFIEQLATNVTYFKDPRLLDIFAFIKENIGGDLSNRILANVANVSEDYVGQYFKMLTGINPQDYIEYQRMEQAVNLLRTTKKSIREIGKEVGYKDTAYFCRRFKMMFGIPAGKMRRRESVMNV